MKISKNKKKKTKQFSEENFGRKTKEKVFGESEEKFNSIFENTNDIIIFLDKFGKILDINKKAAEIFGGSEKELVGKHFTKTGLFPIKELPTLIRNFKNILTAKKIYINVSFKNKKDQQIDLECSASLIKINEVTITMVIARDVTERKKVEETLRESVAKYRLLVENLPQKIFLKDRNSVYISCNENYARDLKIKADEIKGKTDYDFYFKELAEKYRADDKRVMESGKIEDIEEKYTQDGQERFVHTVKIPIRDEQGNVIGILGIFWDITEHKKVEEALKSSEEKLKILFEYAPDAYYLNDLKGNLIDGNKVAEEITGYRREELIGKSFLKLKLLSPDQIQRAAILLAKNALGKSTDSAEFTLNRKDGSRVIVEIRTFPVKIKGKIHVLGIAHDITDRKKAEVTLREEKNKLEQYFNIIGAIIIFFDRDGKIILINKKGCEILGYELKEILKKNWFTDFVLEEDKIKTRAFVKKLIEDKSNQVQYFENYILTKNGKKIFVDWGNIVAKDESGKTSIVLGTGLDITELMESRVAINGLNKINNLKDDFLNIAAHELKTPLTSIIGFSEIMKEQKLFCNPEQENYTNIIHEESSRLAGIVKRILMITRFESGREIIKFEPINLSNFISSFLIKLNIIANKEKSKVIANIEKENIIIKSDEEKISEVIYNFIDNALKYGSDEQVIVISVTKPNKRWVRIAVKNQGKGIPPEKLDQLFNKFSQLESSLVRSQEGTGLGLYICKIIIDSLGGKIGVESGPNKGSTFYFTLPIENVATQKRDLDFKAV